jgi:hypothetical protein
MIAWGMYESVLLFLHEQKQKQQKQDNKGA